MEVIEDLPHTTQKGLSRNSKCEDNVSEILGFDNIINGETAIGFENLNQVLVVIWLLNLVVIFANLVVVLTSGLLSKQNGAPLSRLSRLLIFHTRWHFNFGLLFLGKNQCTYMFVANLSLADFLGGILVILGAFSKPTHINRVDENGCLIAIGLFVLVLLTSAYGILLIAIDRFIYIVYGIKYKSLMFPSRARWMILASWIWCFMVCIPPMFIWRQCNHAEPVCAFIFITPPEMLIFINVTGLLIIVFVCVLHGIVLKVAIKKVIQTKEMMKSNADKNAVTSGANIELRYFKGGTSTNGKRENEDDITTGNSEETRRDDNPKITNCFSFVGKKLGVKNYTNEMDMPKKIKAIKVVVFTCGAFAITWVPYFILTTVFVFCFHADGGPKCTNSFYLSIGPMTVLGYLNSWLNPIIYGWLHEGFRSFLKNFLARAFERFRKVKLYFVSRSSS